MAVNCRGARWGCLDCKRFLADNMAGTLSPIRERAAALAASPERVDEILAEGAAAARTIAQDTMATVHRHMGFMPAAALEPSPARSQD